MKRTALMALVGMMIATAAVAPLAGADDLVPGTDSCASATSFFGAWSGSANGRVWTAIDTKDFYSGDPFGTTATFKLEPFQADADLYVWNNNCSSLLCSSAAGGIAVDQCSTSASGNLKVEVRLFSGTFTDYQVSFTS